MNFTGNVIWLWLAVPVMVLLAWRAIGSKPGAKTNSATAGEVIFLSIVGLVIVGVVIVVVMFVLFLADATGTLDQVTSITTGKKYERPVSECMTPSQLNSGNSKAFEEPKCFYITGEDTKFMLCAMNAKYQLDFKLAQSTINSNPELFKRRSAYTFIKPGDFAGQNCRFFHPKFEAFRDSGLHGIEVVFWSLPR